jgi:hypothetical protein
VDGVSVLDEDGGEVASRPVPQQLWDGRLATRTCGGRSCVTRTCETPEVVPRVVEVEVAVPRSMPAGW